MNFNFCPNRILIGWGQSQQKMCILWFPLHTSVYLKLFWTQLENMHLQGPCCLRPCALLCSKVNKIQLHLESTVLDLNDLSNYGKFSIKAAFIPVQWMVNMFCLDTYLVSYVVHSLIPGYPNPAYRFQIQSIFWIEKLLAKKRDRF